MADSDKKDGLIKQPPQSQQQGPVSLPAQTKGAENQMGPSPVLGSKKHGGAIKKTGLYRLHKGEHVTPHHAKR